MLKVEFLLPKSLSLASFEWFHSVFSLNFDP